MAKHRMKRYSRRTRSREASRVPLIVICSVAFVILCLATSVGIGLMLGKRADEQQSHPKYELERVEYQSGAKTVKSIEGYHFRNGASAADYYRQGIVDFSFCLRHADGSLEYASSVADAVGIEDASNLPSLISEVKAIQAEGGRACGYFYSTAFEEQNEGARSTLIAYEKALLCEMAQSGINEILILGVDVSEKNIGEIEQFLAFVSSDAQKTAIGIAVSQDVLFMTEQEIYLAARLKDSCDFLALDLRYMTLEDAETGRDEDGKLIPAALDETVGACEYYIKTYNIRLVFSYDYSAIYKYAVKLGVVDFQIVGV